MKSVFLAMAAGLALVAGAAECPFNSGDRTIFTDLPRPAGNERGFVFEGVR